MPPVLCIIWNLYKSVYHIELSLSIKLPIDKLKAKVILNKKCGAACLEKGCRKRKNNFSKTSYATHFILR